MSLRLYIVAVFYEVVQHGLKSVDILSKCTFRQFQRFTLLTMKSK